MAAEQVKDVRRAGRDALVEELHRLPVQNTTALRVLALLDDPELLIADLTGLIQTDPSLAARVLKLANSSFFGLRGGVTNVERAIVAIGLSTVRTFTLAAAFDLFTDKGPTVPAGFAGHAVASACGSMALARHTGAVPADAFSAGLLHDLGTALLFRHASELYAEVVLARGLSGQAQLAAEQETFGIDHAQAGATVLRTCGFPKGLVDAVEHHHDEPRRRRGTPDLATLVAVGQALGRRADAADAGQDAPGEPLAVELPEGLDILGLPAGAELGLLDELADIRADVTAFLAV